MVTGCVGGESDGLLQLNVGSDCKKKLMSDVNINFDTNITRVCISFLVLKTGAQHIQNFNIQDRQLKSSL
jgi:hypothetical protein